MFERPMPVIVELNQTVSNRVIRDSVAPEKILGVVRSQFISQYIYDLANKVRDENLEFNGSTHYTEERKHTDACDKPYDHTHWQLTTELLPFGTLAEMKARQDAS